MAEAEDIISRIQGAIRPLIKSRDQVNYIRRIIAVHLAQDGHDQLLKPPFSLVETTDNITDPASSSSRLRREYTEALNANINARREYQQLRDKSLTSEGDVASKSATRSDLLQDHVATLKLRQQRDALFALQSSLEILSEKPAAMEDFLDAGQMFNSIAELPTIPKEVLKTVVPDRTTAPSDLKATISRLERIVLRAKLLLRHEEQLLQKARANFKGMASSPHKLARLEALDATRRQLIDWIESSLTHTSDDQSRDGANGGKNTTPADQSTMLAQLRNAQEKYLNYVSVRQQILQTLDNELPPLATQSVPRSHKKAERVASALPEKPMDHLLTNSVQSLMQASCAHKSVMAQKSHITSTLAKHHKLTLRQMAGLARRSELLHEHPPGKHNEAEQAPRQMNLLGAAQSWTSAAESAKITSLEDVAAHLDTGQNALESSMHALYQIQQFIGDTQTEEEHETTRLEDDGALDEDTWVGAGYSQKQHSRGMSESKFPKSYKRNDMWSKIRGNLGLLGHDGPS